MRAGRVEPRSLPRAGVSLPPACSSSRATHVTIADKIAIVLTLKGRGCGLCPGRRLAPRVPRVMGWLSQWRSTKRTSSPAWGLWAEEAGSEPKSGAGARED